MELALHSRAMGEDFFLLPVIANYTRIARGAESGFHLHPVYHLMFVTEGEGGLENEAGRHPLAVGDIVVVHPGERHIFSAGAAADMTYFTLNFHLASRDAYASLRAEGFSPVDDGAPGRDGFLLRHAETRRLDALFDFRLDGIRFPYDPSRWDRILSEVDAFSALAQRRHDGLLLRPDGGGASRDGRFADRCARFLWDLSAMLADEGDDLAHAREEPLLARAVHYLEEHLHEPYSLEAMASHLNYSHIYLCTYFGRKAGMTPGEYFDRMKIGRACRLLRTTPSPVAEIAATLGYSSPNHFSRNFRRLKGVSPRYYRNHPELT